MKRIGIILLFILPLTSFAKIIPQPSSRTLFLNLIRSVIPNQNLTTRQQLSIPPYVNRPAANSSRTPQNPRLSPQVTFTNFCEGRTQSQCQSESLCNWRFNACFSTGTTVDLVYGTNICNRLNNVQCDANRLCVWDSVGCVAAGLVNWVNGDTACSNITEEQKCKAKYACNWSNSSQACAMITPVNIPTLDPGFQIPAMCDKRERMLACVSDQKCRWSANPTGYCRQPRQNISTPRNIRGNACGQYNQKTSCETPQAYDICIWDGASDECMPKVIGDGASSLSASCYVQRNQTKCETPIQLQCEWQVDINNICISRTSEFDNTCSQIESRGVCEGVPSDAGGQACKWIQNGSCMNK